jgi:hypothetical protein
VGNNFRCLVVADERGRKLRCVLASTIVSADLFRDAEGNRTQIDKISDARRTLEGDDCRDYTPQSLDNLPQQLTRKELGYLFCRDAHKTIDAETAYQLTLEPTVAILHDGESIGGDSTLFIAVTFLPPLALFVIDSGLFWVIRGFRPNREC